MFSSESFNTIGRLRYGPVLYNRNDVSVGRSIERYGEYSGIETSVFNQVLAPGQVVIDAGAHVGVHALFFAKKVGPQGRVLAFEPQRLLYQALCGNMALNSITNAYCWNVALGERPGETTVPYLDPATPHDFARVATGTDGTDAVAVATIDGLELPRLDFLKIDVSGAEEAVLRGGARTIRRFMPLLYVACDRPENQPSLARCLDELGYQMFLHEPPLYNPHNFHDNPENVFGEAVSRNMLCFDKKRAHDLTGFTPVHVPRAA